MSYSEAALRPAVKVARICELLENPGETYDPRTYATVTIRLRERIPFMEADR